jgi:hypothetical protein
MRNLKYFLLSLIGRLSHFQKDLFLSVLMQFIHKSFSRVLSWTLAIDVDLIYMQLSSSTIAITWFIDIILSHVKHANL